MHAGVANELAERIGVPALIVSMCDDLFAEVRRLLPLGQVNFIVSDTRFEAKLRNVFADDAGSENLRIHVNGRDDLSTIPVSAPAYLTRLTRQKMEIVPMLERVIPETSVFSEISARDILRFIVHANSAASSVRSLSGRAGPTRMTG